MYFKLISEMAYGPMNQNVYINPLLKTPWTDAGYAVFSYQDNKRCAEFEFRAADCMEAYGLDRGGDKCWPYIKDLHECATSTKSMARARLMMEERERQFKAGKVKDRFVPDPPHKESSYWNPVIVIAVHKDYRRCNWLKIPQILCNKKLINSF